ncbi:MAG TPA: hypothetical protein VH157_07050 [Bryobacteraceae bacterium]|jgi:hypothetical protein|nr:hypothetical protein [Bryobacteraceae bacterium]
MRIRLPTPDEEHRPTLDEERDYRAEHREDLRQSLKAMEAQPSARWRPVLRQIEEFDQKRRVERETAMLEAEGRWQRLLTDQASEYAARVIDRHGGHPEDFSMMDLLLERYDRQYHKRRKAHAGNWSWRYGRLLQEWRKGN